MSNFICLFSTPLQKHYVTSTRFSHAYLFFILYWVAVLAPPFILVFAYPLKVSPVPTSEIPRLIYSGNYFVSMNGVEASSFNPVDGISVKVSGLAPNSEGDSDRFDVAITSTKFGSTSQLHLALELQTPQGCKLLVHRGSTLGQTSTSFTSYLTMAVEDDADLCKYRGMQETLSHPGAKGITKLATASTALSLSEYAFGTIWTSIPSSTSFEAQMRVSIKAQTKSLLPSFGEAFRLNLIYFVAVLLVNYHVLAQLLGELLNSRIVKMMIRLDPEIQSRN